jgi:hypothetical protein
VFAEPKPVWQCNADNVCAATADGSDLDVATALAKEADVVVTLLASFANEGNDRASLSFDAQLDGSCQLSAPGQDSLVNVLAATGAHIVVAAVAPGAMVAPWKDSVDAILHGFMPGQEYGSALADVLFGKVNPSAKLTLTMPNVGTCRGQDVDQRSRLHSGRVPRQPARGHLHGEDEHWLPLVQHVQREARICLWPRPLLHQIHLLSAECDHVVILSRGHHQCDGHQRGPCRGPRSGSIVRDLPRVGEYPQAPAQGIRQDGIAGAQGVRTSGFRHQVPRSACVG